MPKYPKKITLRKMKYPSPSGYVNIGKYIPPFEKVVNGFGFIGVVIEDYGSGKIMCNVCGKWFEQLPTHISHKHNLNAEEYKMKFGLLVSTALKSKKMRLAQSKIMQGMRASHPKHCYKFVKNNVWAGNRKDKPKAVESRNKYGVCDLQIAERIRNLAKELGKTPTLTDLSERYGAGFMTLLNSRYGSYVKLCHNIGLEANYSNFNPKYSREYFIEKASSNEPSTRILTINEGRAFYRYFKGGIKELRKIVNKIKARNEI